MSYLAVCDTRLSYLTISHQTYSIMSNNATSKNLTTIVIEKQTRLNLRHTGRKDQTYDDLINELLELRERSKKS